jgi:hypothetical protein
MKSVFICLLLFGVSSPSIAQRKQEGLGTNWPPEYKWQVVQQIDNEKLRQITIIPGGESPKTATIMGVIAGYKNVHFSAVDSIIANFQSRVDTGSSLTVLDRSNDTAMLWTLFKVETPKTEKYPEPESDLYYVVQGDYALYVTYVAIKEPLLTAQFVARWSAIFQNSKLSKQ